MSITGRVCYLPAATDCQSCYSSRDRILISPQRAYQIFSRQTENILIRRAWRVRLSRSFSSFSSSSERCTLLCRPTHGPAIARLVLEGDDAIALLRLRMRSMHIRSSSRLDDTSTLSHSSNPTATHGIRVSETISFARPISVYYHGQDSI